MIKFRILHRYLGFFLAGIMMIYAVSGITLIFRTTDTFKQEVHKTEHFASDITLEELGRALRIRDFKPTSDDGTLVTFESGTFNRNTGEASFTAMELPIWLDKLTHLHKATTNDPLYYFNIYFGISLFFFALSSFFMFAAKSDIFKKGIWFTIGGIALAIIMLIWN
jgi:hypothetical protein